MAEFVGRLKTKVSTDGFSTEQVSNALGRSSFRLPTRLLQCPPALMHTVVFPHRSGSIQGIGFLTVKNHLLLR